MKDPATGNELDRPEDSNADAFELLQDVADAAGDLRLVVDGEGTILAVNQSPGCAPPESLRGTRVFDYVPAELLDELRQSLATVMSGRRARLPAFPALLPQQKRRWYSAHAVPVRRNGRVVAAAIVARNITAARRARAALRQSERRYGALAERGRQLQKLEVLGLLTGGIVHDVNNILSVISGSGAVLLESLPPSARHRDDVEAIRLAARRGGALLRQLLTLASQQHSVHERLDLNAIVTDVIAMMRRVLGRHVKLLTQLDPTGAPIHADRGQIEQVLMNLLLNARDSMPNGGSVIVGTVRLPHPRLRASTTCKLRGPVVVLRVEDTGAGMDDVTREHVFDPFFTTKPAGHGTGLGLPTVDAIIKRSGGCVEIASRPGLGTIFDVVLPDIDRAESRAA